ISSFTLATGTDGCTASTCGEYDTITIGEKSFAGSKGMSVYTLGLIDSAPTSESSRVVPSGADLATKSAPTLPLAPVRFSTMTGWPQAVVICGPIARARMSEVPPGAKGTTMRIGLLGYCWACTGRAASRERTAVKAAARRFMDVLRVRSKAECGLYSGSGLVP